MDSMKKTQMSDHHSMDSMTEIQKERGTLERTQMHQDILDTTQGMTMQLRTTGLDTLERTQTHQDSPEIRQPATVTVVSVIQVKIHLLLATNLKILATATEKASKVRILHQG